MTISGLLPIFLVGCFGGAAGELLKWYQLRESPNLPDYAHRPIYWVITAAVIVAGGVLAVLYGVDAKNAILVFNVGLSAPRLYPFTDALRAGVDLIHERRIRSSYDLTKFSVQYGMDLTRRAPVTAGCARSACN